MNQQSEAEQQRARRSRDSSHPPKPRGGPLKKEAEFNLTALSPPRLYKYVLYESKPRFYLLGYDRAKTKFWLLAIDRTEANGLVIREDNRSYTETEVQDLLQMIDDGNRSSGGLTKTCVAYGVIGFIKFLQGYYLLLLTKRRKVGHIGPHTIYGIEDIAYVPVTHPSFKTKNPASREETRYKTLLFGMDLSHCYLSYTYDITNTLQYNMTRHRQAQDTDTFNDRFIWNKYLLEPLRELSPHWILPVVHGYFVQTLVTLFGKGIQLTIVARRSRHFAGVRYLKRGLNDYGNVANDVETEQILSLLSYGALDGPMSSYVQVRGSIPLFWAQDSQTLVPKPPIFMVRADPYYSAAMMHFSDLFQRYDTPVIVLNLVKSSEKKPRETILKDEFEQCIEQLNEEVPPNQRIIYVAWDFHQAQKNKKEDPIHLLTGIAEMSVARTGYFFAQGRHTSSFDAKTRLKRSELFTESGHLQAGIIRTNCIDSLDRTNAGQFCIGKVVLAYQLAEAGVIEDPDKMDNFWIETITQMFEDCGNRLALQYGGSQLAHTMRSYQSKAAWSSQSRDFLETLKRYYSNSFTDSEKQSSMNLFLGYYAPWSEKEKLWELETDYLLHMRPAPAKIIFKATGWGDEQSIPFPINPTSTTTYVPQTSIVTKGTHSTNSFRGKRRASIIKPYDLGPDEFSTFTGDSNFVEELHQVHVNMYDEYYKTDKITSFDDLLKDRHALPVHPDIEQGNKEEKDEKPLLYLPGVKRWFSQSSDNPSKEKKKDSKNANTSPEASKNNNGKENNKSEEKKSRRYRKVSVKISPLLMSTDMSSSTTKASGLSHHEHNKRNSSLEEFAQNIYGINLNTSKQTIDRFTGWTSLSSIIDPKRVAERGQHDKRVFQKYIELGLALLYRLRGQ